MRETQVQSLGGEDPLEKEMATHSSTLAWKIPWMEERGRLQSMGSQRVGHDWAMSLSLSNPTLFPSHSDSGRTVLFHVQGSLTALVSKPLSPLALEKKGTESTWVIEWLPGVGGGENEEWLLVRRSCFLGWWVVLELYSDDSFTII